MFEKKNIQMPKKMDAHKTYNEKEKHLNYARLAPRRKLTQDFTNTISVLLTVQDSGIGIADKDQKSLFKLFGKLTSNHDRNKTGCGLGLTICKKILRKLGGDISLSSKENQGTEVT